MSTQEVEAVVSSVLGQEDSTVYGVLVPNTDGRAGMVAIPTHGGDDDDQAVEEVLVQLRDGLKDKLPPYARPVFVRLVCGELELTGWHILFHLSITIACFKKCNFCKN